MMNYRRAGLCILCVFVMACAMACNNKPEAAVERLSHDDGLTVEVVNSLPEVRSGVTANLHLYVCPGGSVDTSECKRFDEVVAHGETHVFHVPQTELANLHRLGHGAVSFKFEDDQQITTGTAWHCADHEATALHANFANRQDWRVEVTERRTTSFGCIVGPV